MDPVTKKSFRTIRQIVFALCLIGAANMLAAQVGNIPGKWTFLFTGDYSAQFPAELQIEGEHVTGTWAGTPVDGVFKDGELTLDFRFQPPEAEMPNQLNVSGRFDGAMLAGDWSWAEYSGSFKATRRP